MRSGVAFVTEEENKTPLVPHCKLSQHRKEIGATPRTCNALGDPEDLSREERGKERSWENNPSVTHTCTNSEETEETSASSGRDRSRGIPDARGRLPFGSDLYDFVAIALPKKKKVVPRDATLACNSFVFFSAPIIARKRPLPTKKTNRSQERARVVVVSETRCREDTDISARCQMSRDDGREGKPVFGQNEGRQDPWIRYEKS